VTTGFNITLTERAASKIKEAIESEGGNLVLRVTILGQGCCGFRYGMMLDDQVLEDDVVVQNNGIKVVVDKFSANIMAGAEIDYIENEGASGFVVKNPNEASTCTCGGHHTL